MFPSTLHFQFGLVGYPLTHSLSPQIHAAALKACGLKGTYSLFSLRLDDTQGLKNLLARLRKGELHGLNVTMPHKQSVIEYLDDLTPTAKTIGAVNTIYRRENKLIGDNTDAQGFLLDLRHFLDKRTLQFENHKAALVLGAGGSARAVVYALVNDGWKVTLAARRIEQAQHLAESFTNYRLNILALADLQVLDFDLIVNTTPLGMIPHTDQSPLPQNLSFPSNTFIYDLIYNPVETKLVRTARIQGLHATTGLGMLIEQAALAFEIWTGRNPPREILHASIKHIPIL